MLGVLLFKAFPFAMSEFDRAVGHVRRYTVASLTRAFTAAGLDVEQVHYVNMPGLAAWTAGSSAASSRLSLRDMSCRDCFARIRSTEQFATIR